MNYEIHITVPVVDPLRIDKFKSVCESMDVKAIVIEAYPLTDVMTSFRMQSDDQNEVFKVMTSQFLILSAHGFLPIRCKVETDLTHPWVTTPLPNQYFESHLQVWTRDDQMDDLKLLAKNFDFHVSRNAFKAPVDGRHIRMVTVREYHTDATSFTRRVEALRDMIPKHGFELAKGLEIEFALYDSNAKHDTPWIQTRGW